MHASLDEAAWASPWRSHSVAERVGLTLGLAFWALLSPNWWVAVILLFGILAIALLIAKVPARTYWLVLSAPWVFILIGVIAVIINFGSHKDALVSFFGLEITTQSLDAGALIVGRAFAVTAAVMLLACTTPISELLMGMRRIGIPGVLVDISAATYRMIFLLLDRAGAIRRAQAARLGYTNSRRATSSMGQLLATVFVSSWDRARRLEAGLDGRGGTAELVPIRPAKPFSGRFIFWTLIANLLAAALVITIWWWK